MLALAVQTTLILAAAAIAAAALRHASAARRHTVWLLALVTALLIPFAPNAIWPAATSAAPVQASAPPAVLRTIVEVTAQATPASANWLFRLWAAGAILLALRYARSYWMAHRMTIAAQPHESGARLTTATRVPVVCGLAQPVILLPQEARAWPPEQLHSVLAHERMHIRRRDLWWQAIGQLACCIYWPQPLVWFAASAMRKECEQACDDGVLARGVPASSYASHLVTIGRAAVSQPRTALAGGITMAHSSQLEHRVNAILDPATGRAPAGWRFTLAAAGAALALVLAVAAVPMPAWAQTQARSEESGKQRLTGVVQDASGAMVPRARIDVRGANEFYEVVYSGDAGEFSLNNVPDGGYDITVAKPGFARLSLTGFRFEAAKAKPLELTLNIGMISEQVRVEAPAPAKTNTATDAPAGPPKRIRVGGNVQSAQLLHRVPPIYPPTAKADGVQGTVLLRAIIAREGHVASLEPINRQVDQRLVDAALDAVKQWRYRSTLLNGQPVEVITVVEINYTLTK